MVMQGDGDRSEGVGEYQAPPAPGEVVEALTERESAPIPTLRLSLFDGHPESREAREVAGADLSRTSEHWEVVFEDGVADIRMRAIRFEYGSERPTHWAISAPVGEGAEPADAFRRGPRPRVLFWGKLEKHEADERRLEARRLRVRMEA